MLAFTVVELVGLLGLSFYAVGQLLTVLFFLLRPWWVTAATATSNNGEKNNTTCNSKEYPSIVEVSSLLPAVLVQLPLFNEEGLGVRVVESILQQDYNNNKDINNTNNDKNKLYIQILDDSTEARSRNLLTSRLAEWKAKAQERNMEVEYLWRSDRQGYKAGALAAGLTAAPAHIEYVCIFDADYLPDPGVVRSLVQGLLREKEKEKENNNKNRNRKVACLQGRWGYLNPFYNFTTAMQTIILDGHFVVEQWTRSSNLWPLNFNGTAGIWRRDAIEDAGGWSADTLTEDLDLSYRVQLRGWRIIYDPNLVIKGEVPSYISAFITQQIRWARGSMQVAKKILPSVWQSEIRYLCNLFNKGEKKDDDVEEGRLKEGEEEKDVLTWQAKLSATYHLTGYFQTVLMLMIQLGFLPKWYFVVGMVGPGLTYTISILHQALLGGGRDTKKEEEEVAGCWWGWCKKIKMNDPLWLRILLLPLIPFFLNGMSLVILVGLVKGLLDTCGCSGEFVRTKKTGDATTTTTETTTKNNNVRGEWRLLLDRGYLYLLDSIPLFRTIVILLQRESLAFLAGGALMLATSFISDWTNLVGCLALAVVFYDLHHQYQPK